MKYTDLVLSWLALSTLFGLGFGFSPFGITTITASAALGAALAVVFVAGRPWSLAPAFAMGRPSWPDWTVAVLFALFAIRAFSKVIFLQGDSVRVLSPNNLGDICLHLTHINYLAANPPFWPKNPIFVFDQLRYPLGINLFNAELKLIGIEPKTGLILVAFLGSILTFRALFRFGGAFGVAAFLCNGGLAGFLFFQTGLWKDYQADVAWKSIPLAMFVTQRGWLYALPAGLMLLVHWRARLFDHDARRVLPFWAECLLYASMPLFNLHTFLFLSWMLGCWFVFGASDGRPHLLRLVGAALVPASLLVYFVTGFEKTSGLGFHPGWMQGPHEEAWSFWLVNFGLFLPLSLTFLGFLAVSQSVPVAARRRLRLFAYPSAAVLVACAFVKFAPWEWDNNKLMLWAYLVLMVALWEGLLSRWPWWARTAAVATLFFSGFVSLVGGLVTHGTGYEIGSASEWAEVADGLRGLPADAVFAGYPTYNHPVLVTGHRMVMGFPGHLWSHGLNYRPVEKDLEALLRGRADWPQLARRLRVDYLFWGDLEDEQYTDSAHPWESNCPVVADGDWGTVYDLRAIEETAP
ncbi:MAG TPA: hypothetical protein VGD78_10375 [Chthoniobacterales bacterium]